MHSTLAEFILFELYRFPGKCMVMDDLKTRACRETMFAALPEEEWVRTLQRLADKDLIICMHVSSGISGEWGAVYDAGITHQGKEIVRILRAVQEEGDRSFEHTRKTLFAELLEGNQWWQTLQQQYGDVPPQQLPLKVKGLVLDQLRRAAQQFAQSYIQLIDATDASSSDFYEQWLTARLDTIWSDLVTRAITVGKHLCAAKGIINGDAQLDSLPRQADEVREHLRDQIRSAVLKRHRSARISPDKGATMTDFWSFSDDDLEQLATQYNIPPYSRTGEKLEQWYVDRSRIIDELVKRDNALREGKRPRA